MKCTTSMLCSTIEATSKLLIWFERFKYLMKAECTKSNTVSFIKTNFNDAFHKVCYGFRVIFTGILLGRLDVNKQFVRRPNSWTSWSFTHFVNWPIKSENEVDTLNGIMMKKKNSHTHRKPQTKLLQNFMNGTNKKYTTLCYIFRWTALKQQIFHNLCQCTKLKLFMVLLCVNSFSYIYMRGLHI